MTEDEYVRADRTWQEHAKASEKAAAARSQLPAGSTRAKVTTANARWARAAEARDARDRKLREEYRKHQDERGRANAMFPAAQVSSATPKEGT